MVLAAISKVYYQKENSTNMVVYQELWLYLQLKYNSDNTL